MRCAFLRFGRDAIAAVIRAAGRADGSALRPSALIGGLVVDVCRSRSELVAENAMLRQRLIVASRAIKRRIFPGHEPRSHQGLGQRIAVAGDRAPLARSTSVAAISVFGSLDLESTAAA
jgi:hypothetical protein